MSNLFEMLMKVGFDKNSANSEYQKLVTELKKNKFEVKPDIDFAKSKQEIEKQIKQIATIFKNGLNLDDKSANKYAKSYYDEIVKGVKSAQAEQTKLNNLQEKNSKDYWQGRFKDSVSDITKTNSKLVEMKQYYSQIEAEQTKLASAMTRAREQSELKSKTTTKNEELAQTSAINKALENEYSIVQKINQLNSSGKITTDFSKVTSDFNNLSNKTTSLKTAFQTLQTAKQNFENSDNNQALISNYQKYNSSLESVRNKIEQVTIEQKELNKTDAFGRTQSGAINKINSFLTENTKLTSSSREQFTRLKTAMESAGDSRSLRNLVNESNNLQRSLKATGETGRNLGDEMKNNLKKFSNWVGVSAVFFGVQRFAKEGVRFITELDSALATINMTMPTTANHLEELGNKSIKMAENLKTSASEVLKAVAIYANANESIDSILEKAQPTIMLSTASGIDTSTTADIIQGALNQFDLAEDQAMHVSDVYQKVSEQIAVDFKKGISEMSQAVQVSGSVAKDAGLSLEQYSSMVAKVVEQTRLSGSTVGTAFRTIFTRITKASSSGESSDEDISKAETALRAVGVEVRKDKDTFREMDDVLGDLAEKWNTISDTQKSNIAYQIAGVRQTNIVTSLLKNYNEYIDLIDQADQATGTSVENQAIYEETITARTKEFIAQIQELWNNVISSDAIKGIVSGGNQILKVINSITSALGSLGTIGLGTAIFAGSKNFNLSNLFTSGLGSGNLTEFNQNIINQFNNSTRSIAELETEFGRLSRNMPAYLSSVERGTATMDGFAQHTVQSRSALMGTFKTIASNIGVMLAFTAAIKVAVWAFDELNVTFEEQKEIVDALSTKISTLKDEYTALSEKKDKTKDDEDQLKYLDRQLEVQKELYKVEYNRLALKDLEGKGDILSTGNLKDLNPKSSGTVNEVYSLSQSDNIEAEIAKLEDARKRIAESPNVNTAKYWDKEQDKSIASLKKYREDSLDEWKEFSDSYNLIKPYMDNGAFDDDPVNKAKYQAKMDAYKAKMDELERLTNNIELKIGISPTFDDAIDKVNELKKEAEEPITISMAISDIDSLSDGFEKISSIYNDIKDKGDFDFGSLVDEDFVATFSQYEGAYNNFIETIANSPTDIEACQKAFDDLTTEWFYGQDALKNITDETYNSTVAMLEQKGVANASAIASSALAKSKIDAFVAGKDLVNVTEDEIRAFLQENGVIDVTNNMIYALQLAKMTANATSLNFADDIDNIIEFTEKLGGSIVALKMLNEAKKAEAQGANSYAWSGMSDVASAAKQEVQDAISNAMDIKVDYKAPSTSKSSSSSNSSSTTEAYKAEIDAYAKLQAELDKIQSDISANEKKYDNTDSEREKIALLQQRIALTQKEQSALHNLNNARDKEISNNVKLLQQQGFLVDYNPDSNKLEIANLEHLNELKGKNQEETNDLVKEYEELINSTKSLNEENQKTSTSWWESYYGLAKYKSEIEDLNKEIFDNEVDNQNHILELLASRSGTEAEQIALLKDMQEKALNQRQKYVDEDYEKNIDEIRKLENAWKGYYDDILELQKESLEAQKANQDATLSAVTNVLDEEINKLQEEKDALSDENDERERKIKLQELEANLAKANSQKTAYIYREGKGFDYELNQTDVDEAQNAINDYNAELALKAKQDALQDEIDSLQEYKEKYEAIATAVEGAENEQIAAMLLGSNWKSKIRNQDINTYKNFKDDYIDVETSLNETTTELADHLDTEFTRIIESFQKMAEAFGIEFDFGTSTETTNAGFSKDDTKKSSGSIFSKIIVKATDVISSLTGNTSTYNETLEDNNSNLKTSSDAVKNNETSVKDNTTNIKSNSTYISDNSDTLDDNSSTMEDLMTTLGDTASKIVGAADSVVQANKLKSEEDDEDSNSGSSSSGGSSIFSKVVSGISNFVSGLTKHHSGGIIGSDDDKTKALFELSKQKLKPDEEVSVLQHGEIVLTTEQQSNIIDRLNQMSSYDQSLFSSLSSNLGNSSGYLPNNFNVPTGVVSDYSVNGSRNNGNNIVNNINVQNDFAQIGEVALLQEAMLTFPQVVNQIMTTGYNR